MNNENNPHLAVVALGSLSADAVLPAIHFPKKTVIKSVKIMNGATVAPSDTNYAKLSLKNGAVEVAELDTRAAQENGLTQNEAKSLNLVSGKEIQEAGSNMTIGYDETDSGTAIALTNAILIIEHYPL